MTIYKIFRALVIFIFILPVTSKIVANDFDTTFAAQWLEKNGTDPRGYLAQKFDKYDIVILGEEHRVHQFTEFVAGCIPALYKHGVRELAMEFDYSINQPLIDSFLALPWLDNGLLYQFRRGRVGDSFGLFKEYADIFRECWQFNRALAQDSTPFRIVALDLSSDDPSYEAEGGEWGRDSHMFKVLDREVISRGKKVLVYCGWMHAMSRLVPPKLIDGRPSDKERRVRLGNHIQQSYPERVFSVFFYVPYLYTPDSIVTELRLVIPVNGIIEAVMERLGSKPLGFDMAPSPFAGLSSLGAFFRFIKKDWAMVDVCDGMLFLCPVKEWQAVVIENIYLSDSIFHSCAGRAGNAEDRLTDYLKVQARDPENTIRHIKTDAYDNVRIAE